MILTNTTRDFWKKYRHKKMNTRESKENLRKKEETEGGFFKYLYNNIYLHFCHH